MDRLRTLRRPELHPYLTEVPVTSHKGDTSREDQHILGDNTSSSLVKRVFVRQERVAAVRDLLAVAGLVLSAVSASSWYAYLSSLGRQAAASSLGGVRSIMGTSLERDNDLVGHRERCGRHPSALTNGSLVTFLSRLDPSQSYPGSIAFTYVESVSSAGLPRFEAVTQRDPPLGVDRCKLRAGHRLPSTAVRATA